MYGNNNNSNQGNYQNGGNFQNNNMNNQGQSSFDNAGNGNFNNAGYASSNNYMNTNQGSSINQNNYTNNNNNNPNGYNNQSQNQNFNQSHNNNGIQTGTVISPDYNKAIQYQNQGNMMMNNNGNNNGQYASAQVVGNNFNDDFLAADNFKPGNGQGEIVSGIVVNGNSGVQMGSVSIEIPKKYIDKQFTKEIMYDPIKTPDGNSYEREQFIEFLATKKFDPMTFNYMEEKNISDNTVLKQEIEGWLLSLKVQILVTNPQVIELMGKWIEKRGVDNLLSNVRLAKIVEIHRGAFQSRGY